LTKIIGDIYKMLPSGGVLSCSFKKWTGEEWTSDKLGAPRFFKYWHLEEISVLLTQAGFSLPIAKRIHTNAQWIVIVAQK
jgi:hypothetical protein